MMRRNSNGKRAPSGALAAYIKHAERFGTEMAFETAGGLTWPYRSDLSLRELGQLSLRLQNIDPKWQLPKDEFPPGDALYESRHPKGLAGVDFALMLVAEGVPEKKACEMAMISPRAMQRAQRPAREMLQQVLDVANRGREPAFQSGAFASNRGGQGDSLHPRQMALRGA